MTDAEPKAVRNGLELSPVFVFPASSFSAVAVREKKSMWGAGTLDPLV